MAVAEALATVAAKVAAASARFGCRAPRLVAVSKTKPVEMLREAYDAGQRHFGENYVQELVEKAPQMPDDVKWHFIGHLQTNKAKLIAGVKNVYVVESVDSVKLANALNKCIAADREPLKVMVQVNTSGEESKSGVEPAACNDLVRHVLTECAKLQFVGLMTIGRLGDVSPECFQTLASCRDSVLAANIPGAPAAEEFELSMGMSGDFELAIECGSTNVRVGSTIFGSRVYPKKEAPEAAVAEAKPATEAAPTEEPSSKEVSKDSSV